MGEYVEGSGDHCPSPSFFSDLLIDILNALLTSNADLGESSPDESSELEGEPPIVVVFRAESEVTILLPLSS